VVSGKKIPCPVCQKPMVWAKTDLGPFKEKAKNGEIIEVIHVYFGCPDDVCKTIIRLRFRKDGKEGDLWRTMKARQAGHGRPIVTDFGGSLKEITG
jgi:hypothetical protein